MLRCERNLSGIPNPMKNLPSKDNNQFKIDFDFPGLCVNCHTEIAEFSGSSTTGRPIITAIKPNSHQMKVELDDKSVMTVMLCTDCFFDVKPDDMKAIMESVINGWQSEVDSLEWEDDKKFAHMDRYSKKRITNRADFPYSESDAKNIKKPDSKKLRVKVRD